MRSGLRNWVLFPALVFYITLLAFAAWRPEVQPRFLEGTSRTAKRILSLVGIRAGIAVFSDPRSERTDLLPRAECIEVRGFSAAGDAHELYPPDGTGRCKTSGIRLRIPPFERVHHRLMIEMAHDSQRGKPLGDWRTTRLGEFYCAARGEGALSDVVLHWYYPMVSYRTGEHARSNALLLQWRCGVTPELVRGQWNPLDKHVKNAFRGAPWD